MGLNLHNGQAAALVTHCVRLWPKCEAVWLYLVFLVWIERLVDL